MRGYQHAADLIAPKWTPKEDEAPLSWRDIYFVANKVQECIFFEIFA